MNITKQKLAVNYFTDVDGKRLTNLKDGANPFNMYGYNVCSVNSMKETNYVFVKQEDIDKCNHPAEYIKLGRPFGQNSRECDKCGGYQIKKEGIEWPKKWDTFGSRMISSSETNYPIDLVNAIVKSGDYDLWEAIILTSHACERCVNVLMNKYIPGTGYEEFSEDWHKAGTTCRFCHYTYETPAIYEPIEQQEAKLPEPQNEEIRPVEQQEENTEPIDVTKEIMNDEPGPEEIEQIEEYESPRAQGPLISIAALGSIIRQNAESLGIEKVEHPLHTSNIEYTYITENIIPGGQSISFNVVRTSDNAVLSTINFQDRPFSEDVNGVSVEDLLAICLIRLETLESKGLATKKDLFMVKRIKEALFKKVIRGTKQ